MSTRLSRISNIILRVEDLERSLAFYRDRLGMTALGSSESFAFLSGGGVTLVLNAIGADMEENPPGLVEVVFEVDDVEATYEALSGAGVPFRLEPRVVMNDGGRDLMAADFRDPDGNVLSITGWREAG
jgi:catechol 2,3-dioxygenase-like lactoylglutathione lyase family enzyme